MPSPLQDATLRQLLAHDEDGVLELVVAPSGSDVPVRGVVIGDEDTGRSHAGRIVLATEPVRDITASVERVHEVARRGACALVLRDAGAAAVPGEIVEAARASGLALLVRASWADWADTVELIRSARAFAALGTGDRLVGDIAGGGLAVLAAEVARYCGASLTVEDTQFRVLAHSATGPDADPVRRSTILGGKVPDWRVAELRRAGLLRALWSSRDVIHRAADDSGPERLIVAIRSGGEMLGSIWAAADGDGFTPEAPEALRRAAEVAAPYLLQHRLRVDAKRRREEHAVRGLLAGDGDGHTHLWTLGLTPDIPCAVLVAEQDEPTAPLPERTFQALALQAQAHRPTARYVRESRRLTVLLPVPDGRDRDAATLARDLASLAAALPDAPVVRVGVGPVVGSALDAAASADEALLIVRALREREARALAAPGAEPPPRYAGPADVRQSVAVLRVLDAVRPLWERHDGPVHDMIAADLAAGGELVRSLTAYLDAAGDVPRAAQRLVLHPNTLRYRLKRVRDRFGLDLDDPDTRLIITLAVRLATADDHLGGQAVRPG
ncbi:CdaR family transcriptional regulator [Streptomyces sp. VRA16 Mangrove soil]|uniref:PucR family transcriptional regulator n=1 Tax=Streptomyces sp. VRA16 Mangrove soil TaxID=2817434 RepID=UPI001A9CF610|nr:helix-turn-helix domain-containing protein [Streptomyces sp. VRA16 Mangrove soil]MBO1332834.1 helix-turn-helix domain-containing protein [Streptomyces sp. VRA16 Mangrove soil]